MQIEEVKYLITGGFLTVVASIAASWATIKLKVSFYKETTDKELKDLKEGFNKMEQQLKAEIQELNRLLHMFIDDGGSCDARQRSCKEYIYSRVLDDHGRPLFVDKSDCAEIHQDIKDQFNKLNTIDSKLNEILREVKLRND